jgi:hypothetical protein
MLSVENKPFKLTVVMLSVVMLNVVAPQLHPHSLFNRPGPKDKKTFYSHNILIFVIR